MAVGLRERALGLHKDSIPYARLGPQGHGNPLHMLRKALWTGLYAGLGAGATMAARRLASGIWRVATGEEPPTKK